MMCVESFGFPPQKNEFEFSHKMEAIKRLTNLDVEDGSFDHVSVPKSDCSTHSFPQHMLTAHKNRNAIRNLTKGII